jgi:hypothetical protein
MLVSQGMMGDTNSRIFFQKNLAKISSNITPAALLIYTRGIIDSIIMLTLELPNRFNSINIIHSIMITTPPALSLSLWD